MTRWFLLSVAMAAISVQAFTSVLTNDTAALANPAPPPRKTSPSFIPLPSYSDRLPEMDLLTNVTTTSRHPLAIPANNISPRSLTKPSFWWIRDQLPHRFANKLVLNWVAYPDKNYVDILVNPQFWNLLEYGERYALVNRFGTAARQSGYNVRIFNSNFSKEKPIAAYTCTANPSENRCRIQFQEKNQRLTNTNLLQP
jgi:hypothetical protein